MCKNWPEKRPAAKTVQTMLAHCFYKSLQAILIGYSGYELMVWTKHTYVRCILKIRKYDQQMQTYHVCELDESEFSLNAKVLVLLQSGLSLVSWKGIFDAWAEKRSPFTFFPISIQTYLLSSSRFILHGWRTKGGDALSNRLFGLILRLWFSGFNLVV